MGEGRVGVELTAMTEEAAAATRDDASGSPPTPSLRGGAADAALKCRVASAALDCFASLAMTSSPQPRLVPGTDEMGIVHP